MKDELRLTCLVTNGRIPREDSEVIREALRRVSGQRVEVIVRKHVKKRSPLQNRFYWGVVVPMILDMFEDAGNTTSSEEVHEFLKQYVGGNTFVRILLTPDGGRRAVVRSSATLTTAEFEDYMEKIRAWAAQFGVIVPLPNEDLIHGRTDEDHQG